MHRRTDAVRAKAYARLLARGYATPPEVVAWVDERITGTAEPAAQLLDASLCAANRAALIGALNAFGDAGGADDATVSREVLAALHAWFESHPAEGRRIAHSLYEMATAGEYPDSDARYEMCTIKDRYELADIFSTSQQAGDALRVFLARYEQP
jgi:hypothetical protein